MPPIKHTEGTTNPAWGNFQEGIISLGLENVHYLGKAGSVLWAEGTAMQISGSERKMKLSKPSDGSVLLK